jgi:hypothetical protein
MADDHGSPGIDECMRLFDLSGAGDAKAFFSPMGRDQDMIDLAG